PRSREPEIGVGPVIGLPRRRRDRLDIDPHPVHVLDPPFGGRALDAGAHAVLAVYVPTARIGLGLEKPARNLFMPLDQLRRFLAADMAVDVDREPFAAGMHRPGKSP